MIDAAPSITATIGGTAQEGQTLAAQVSGAESDDALSYQWMSGTTVLGTGANYVVQQSDVGSQITLNVSDVADNGGGTATASATTGTVFASIAATIGGTAQEGQTLTAQVTGAGGGDTLSYQWASGTTVLGTGASYVVQEGDEGNLITLNVTDTNAGGTSTASATTPAVIDAAPSITATIGGTAQEGQTLAAQVSGAESDDALSYQWMSGTTVLGTGANYVVQQSDVGSQITLNVSDVADNGGGTATASATTGTVFASIAATIGGTAQEGQTLTAQVTGAGGGDTLSYQWASGTTVLGTGASYVVQEGDEGNLITLNVTDTNAGGTSTASATTPAVIDAAPSITATIGGTAQEGQTLAAQVSGAESDDALSYQWMSGTTVLGTGANYVVQQSDVGSQITLNVSDVADNGGGTATASATTGTVFASIAATIGGTAQEGQTLTAQVTGAGGGDTLSYQWASGTTVLGTGASYVVQEGDEGNSDHPQRHRHERRRDVDGERDDACGD